jgi:hypothetical protein
MDAVLRKRPRDTEARCDAVCEEALREYGDMKGQ